MNPKGTKNRRRVLRLFTNIRRLTLSYTTTFLSLFLVLGIIFTVGIVMFLLYNMDEPIKEDIMNDWKTMIKVNNNNENDNDKQQQLKQQIPMSTRQGKEYVIEILHKKAGIDIDVLKRYYNKLPTWEQIIAMYGEHPIVLGYNYNDNNNNYGGSCLQYQSTVRGIDRMIGSAGMFSTGTNLVTQLLKENCYIPERYEQYMKNNHNDNNNDNTSNNGSNDNNNDNNNSNHNSYNISTISKEQLGMRWQVPWGKHTPAHYRTKHTTKSASSIDKDSILPIVTIRNPWRWMQSMCKNPYAAVWDHSTQCPNLRLSTTNSDNTNNNSNNNNYDSNWNPVTVTYGAGVETYKSLLHLWNDWYNEYYAVLLRTTATTNNNNNDNTPEINTSLTETFVGNGSTNSRLNTSSRSRRNTNNNTTTSTTYPLLMVRMEDLIFHTEETITIICTCAGGLIRTDRNFQYIQNSAKAKSPRGHDLSIGLMEAWIRYSQPLEYPYSGFTQTDYEATIEAIDTNLLHLFQYTGPEHIRNRM